MDQEKSGEEPIVDQTAAGELKGPHNADGAVGLSFPSLKSSLGTRMGKAGTPPPSVLASYSSPGFAGSTGEQNEDFETATPIECVESSNDEPVARAQLTDLSAPRINEELLLPAAPKIEPVTRLRLPRWTAFAGMLCLMFSAGALAGFVLRGDRDATSARDLQSRIADMTEKLNAYDRRLFTDESEAKRKAEELKRLADDAEDKRRMSEDGLNAKLKEALQKVEAFKRLAEDAEIKRQEAQNEFKKVTSFVTLPQDELMSWPPDPPKVVAASIVPVEMRSTSPSQKRNDYRGVRKRRAQGPDEANN